MDIQSKWRDNAYRLADWTIKHLVNRGDCYGNYANGKTFKLEGTVNRDLLAKHFAGIVTIGLYSNGVNGFGKWCCIDIDAHNGGSDVVKANGRALDAIRLRCEKIGLNPLIENSNGKGGVHVWLIFSQPVEINKLRNLGLMLIEGLDIVPEVFPKQTNVTEYGNYVRVFGRHHKHRTFSTIMFTPDTIEAILNHVPNSIDLIPDYVPTMPTRGTGEHTGGIRSSGKDYWDAFARSNTWDDLLTPHGWVEESPNKWTRPDKVGTGEHGATTNDYCFFCFTSEGKPFVQNGKYNKCQVAYTLNYEGNAKAFYNYLERNYYNDLTTIELQWYQTNKANGS